MGILRFGLAYRFVSLPRAVALIGLGIYVLLDIACVADLGKWSLLFGDFLVRRAHV